MVVKTWVWVVSGIVLVIGLMGAVLIGLGIFIVARQVDIQETTPASAQREFEQIRTKFSGQKPLIEIRENYKKTVINRDTRKRGDAPLEAVHVLAWDPKDDKLVRLSIPFWLLKWTGRRSLKVSLDEAPFDFKRFNITAKDLEGYGPGLILDQEDERGMRVLVWTQ